MQFLTACGRIVGDVGRFVTILAGFWISLIVRHPEDWIMVYIQHSAYKKGSPQPKSQNTINEILTETVS